ncbi:hypothetical protein SUGI_0104240 [Cryptomeria japonica]|uniref:G-type lectin S-receptor-like serine/threonine-protein kinase LECRK3 n=1 Tax=Cryptomeria japonica TaxID=3369 RepID=UPI002408AC3A|nr:G-type lectin S-receptor-like serine/threonine-protein kinase LECRK3 [Cryptomeria japonica]GLJ09231.1 hypothetical protein SUGI_0104240 [Cryptomeria japonica]
MDETCKKSLNVTSSYQILQRYVRVSRSTRRQHLASFRKIHGYPFPKVGMVLIAPAFHMICFTFLLAVRGTMASCGLNAICKLDGDSCACTCPPGFHFSDAKNTSKGCLPNSSPQLNNCRAPAEMESVGHFDWPGNDYENINPIDETSCMQACLKDCFCTVAIYAVLDSVGNCWKKALPLIDGKVSNTRRAFVKVYGESIHKPREERKGIVLAAIGLSLMGFCLAIVACFLVIWFCVWRPKLRVWKKGYKFTSEGLKIFSYREIEVATQGFRQVLGKGAFGKVYKGILSDGRAVAVKKLDNPAKQGEEAHIGEKEFRTEMITIGSIHHKNLAELYGFCNEGLHRILVYEYMPNGSLDKMLFRGENHLDWELRVEIALETARGILYLHEECRSHVLHCDIKPQNILLGEIYNVKLCDFGVAKLVGSEQTRTFTGARGTLGYMAPEWQRGVAITVKVDVYSFGVTLLEIICCRKMAKEDVPENETVLSEWAYDCLKDGGLVKLVERQQTSGINPRQLERMVLVGLWCIQDDPSLRPSIKKVVQMLEGNVEIPVPPRPGPPGLSSQASFVQRLFLIDSNFGDITASMRSNFS